MSIPSDNIKVFPCTNRSSEYHETSKLMSEQNITNIIKSIVGNKSYVIAETANTVEFVIQGYYFNYTYTSNDKKENRLYASISKFKDTNLLMGDGDSGFEGLTISNSRPTSDLLNEGVDYLVIYEKSVGGAPVRSKVKFTPEDIHTTPYILDCGELK